MACKKAIIKRLCVATSGACALALATAALPVFDSAREIAIGQTPATDAKTSDVVLPNATLPNAEALTARTPQKANLDPFNLSLGARQNNGTPGAAPSETSELDSLRSQMQELQARLQKAPTSAQEQEEQRQIVNELAALQAQVQRLETTAGNFAAYRQARDLQNGIIPSNDPTAAMNAMTQAYNQRDAFDSNASAGISRIQALNASGLGSNALAARIDGAGTQLTEGEASLLREQKAGLTQQYRQIQQTLRALQPGDEALSANLRQEQATILEQLKEIDEKLSSAPEVEQSFDVAPDQYSIPIANQLPNFKDATMPEDGVAVRMQKANQAAQLLREAGLVQLANYAANESTRLADPNFVETNLTPGAWSESDGLAETRNNPFQQITPQDLEGITSSIDDLKAKVDALTETMTNVEAQLKLLTRVSGYIATPEETQPEIQSPEVQKPVETPTQAEESKVEETNPETAAPNENAPAVPPVSLNPEQYEW